VTICAHCGAPRPTAKWHLTACADGSRKRTYRLCDRCDVELNRRNMKFLGVPDVAAKIRKYRQLRD
jgi:hypothetical protein